MHLPHFYLLSFHLLIIIPCLLILLLTVESKTYYGDTQALQNFKNSVDLNSVSPGSCLNSWDFNVDPCDNLFSERFTCGFRCDLVVSGRNRVTELTLDQPGYSGSLTSISFNLPYLTTLDLSGNSFSGSVPNSLSNLTRLSRLGLSSNKFSGEIPYELGKLSKLEELYLDNNNLQGSIPGSFNGLTSLKRLELQSNKLSGEFAELSSLKNLNFLDITDNNISGQVPATLPASLVQISMRNNSLEGSIPSSFNRLSYLQVIDLSHNRLSNSVPETLFTHPSLQQLTLSFNKLTSIQSPPLMTNEGRSELIAVDLSNNEIRGFLPYFMALMPKLSALSMEKNELTGMIPMEYALKTVLPGSGVAQFERLLLGGNYLFGPIPGPMVGLDPDSADVSFVDNCLYSCPVSLFFCQGGEQKSLRECKRFGSIIP